MGKLSDEIRSSVLSGLILACLVATGTGLLRISGHEIRISQVEKTQDTQVEYLERTTEAASGIKAQQKQIIYQLCVIMNDGDLGKCM